MVFLSESADAISSKTFLHTNTIVDVVLVSKTSNQSEKRQDAAFLYEFQTKNSFILAKDVEEILKSTEDTDNTEGKMAFTKKFSRDPFVGTEFIGFIFKISKVAF